MRQERFEGRNVGWRSEGEAIATVAEWLRRLTRNQIPFGSAGSNPAGCEFFLAPDKDPLNVPSLCIPL